MDSTEENIILYQDECSLSNTASVSYQWSEKGKQPCIVQKQGKKERKTIFGAVNPRSGEVIAKIANKGNADTFKQLLKKVLRHYKNHKGKIFMVLDNARFHHAKVLKPFLETHQSKLELIFLPPYSPDLNPVERVWWYMRKKISHNRYVDTLKNRIKNFWKMFSHFQKPNDFIVNLCNINFSV